MLLFILFFLYFNFYAMNKEVRSINQKQLQTAPNYFQRLPEEVQELIASYITPYPGRDDIIHFICYDADYKPDHFENNNFKVYINENGNIKYVNKTTKKPKTEALLTIKHTSKIKKALNAAKEIIHHNTNFENKITKIAVSPDHKQLVALESICSWGKEENQKGLWYVDLVNKENKFIEIPELFSNICLTEITYSQAEEYEQNGYKLISFGYDGNQTLGNFKKLFESIAITNDKKIALADAKNIYVIDPETKKYEIKHSFEQVKDSIISLQFNKQGTVIKIVAKEGYNGSIFSGGTSTETVKIDKEPQKILAEYFYKMRVCTPKQLIGN